MNKLGTFMRESGPARFFIPVGFILIIVGILILSIHIGNQNYVEIQSTISRVEISEQAYIDSDGNSVNATYKVNVVYTVDGKEYEQELDGVSKYEVGEQLKIYYNPDDPRQITQTKSLVLPTLFIVGGFAAFACGIISAVNAVKKRKIIKEQEKGWSNNG